MEHSADYDALVSDIARHLRATVQVGPFGPNAQAVMENGGKVSLTPGEAEALARAALDVFAGRVIPPVVSHVVADPQCELHQEFPTKPDTEARCPACRVIPPDVSDD